MKARARSMASGYKVRLGDGSEIGPLDLAAVRDWYRRGLINKQSPVLAPGSTRWTTLSQVGEFKGQGGKETGSAELRAAVEAASRSGSPTSAAPRGAEARSRPPSDWSLADHGRTLLAALLFFAAAAGVGLVAWAPQRGIPELEGLPRTEIALALFVSGLILVRGWEWARKLVRVVVLLLAIAMFPLMGILVAQGLRGSPLLVALSAWVFFSGLFAFLSGSDLGWFKATLALLVAVGGAAGAGYFGSVPDSLERRLVREWTSADRRFEDEALGVSFQLPAAWRILRKDNPLVPAPPEAKLTLAQPGRGGFGFFMAESSPSGVASLDQYLNRLEALRRRSVPALRETSRSDVTVGRVNGRKALAAWEKEGVSYRDQTAVWKDGWVYFALVEWVPEGGPSPPDRELDALLRGFSTNGALAARLQQAVQNVTLAVPHLSPAAAEMLMGQSQARVLEPDQAFRRAMDAVAHALPTWSKDDAQDFAQITAAAYASLTNQDRKALATYVDRVRAQQLTSPEDDREMSRLMRGAVLRLPATKRERLQALYEQAIRSSGG